MKKILFIIALLLSELSFAQVMTAWPFPTESEAEFYKYLDELDALLTRYQRGEKLTALEEYKMSRIFLYGLSDVYNPEKYLDFVRSAANKGIK